MCKGISDLILCVLLEYNSYLSVYMQYLMRTFDAFLRHFMPSLKTIFVPLLNYMHLHPSLLLVHFNCLTFLEISIFLPSCKVSV